MKLSDYVVDFISRQGVKHVFMLPGGGAMHLNDSLGKHPSLKYVSNLHEQGCAIAAEAYAQFTGNLGVVMVTTGPGGTNTVTGVAGAWLESTPMLFVSGQVKRADLVGPRGVRQVGFQEIDIVSIVKPITKFAAIVTDPQKIRCQLEEAVWHATQGRKGPVWVDIPLDVQAAEIDPEKLTDFAPPAADPLLNQKVAGAAHQCLDLLKDAQRPVVLVGNGVRHAGAQETFLRWAEMIGIPVLTTWKALDLIEEKHPLFIGRPGAVGQRAANFAQQTSDLFISLGARLDFGQTAYNHSSFAPKAKRVVIDIDPHEIAKLEMNLSISLHADVGLFLTELIRNTPKFTLPHWKTWRERCLLWKKMYPLVLPEYKTVSGGIHNYSFIEEIGRQLGNGDLLVPGSSGACSEVTCQALRVQRGLRFINTQGLGAMGFGVPAALGACIASGGCRTVCIDGDGGFFMNAQELAVCSRLNLPTKFFVLNNNGYNSIRTTQINYFEQRFMACDPASGLTLPDLRHTAESCNMEYFRIEKQSNLAAQIAEALETRGPVVCEVIMVPGQFTQPKVSSKQMPGGRMQTMPMEDLWPFLERVEFERNMQV